MQYFISELMQSPSLQNSGYSGRFQHEVAQINLSLELLDLAIRAHFCCTVSAGCSSARSHCINAGCLRLPARGWPCILDENPISFSETPGPGDSPIFSGGFHALCFLRCCFCDLKRILLDIKSTKWLF